MQTKTDKKDIFLAVKALVISVFFVAVTTWAAIAWAELSGKVTMEEALSRLGGVVKLCILGAYGTLLAFLIYRLLKVDIEIQQERKDARK